MRFGGARSAWDEDQRISVAIRVLVMVASGCFGVVLVAIVGWWATGANPSELSGWVGAVATLAAFAGAVVAAWFAAGAFRLETDREERWVEGQRSQQAALVSGWWGSKETRWGSGDGPEVHQLLPTAGLIQEPGVFLRNASDLPVYSVTVDVTVEVSRMSLRSSAPTGPPVPLYARHELGTIRLAVLPPGPAAVHEALDSEAMAELEELQKQAFLDGADVRVHLEITFGDTGGRFWTRGADGRLQLDCGD